MPLVISLGCTPVCRRAECLGTISTSVFNLVSLKCICVIHLRIDTCTAGYTATQIAHMADLDGSDLVNVFDTVQGEALLSNLDGLSLTQPDRPKVRAVEIVEVSSDSADSSDTAQRLSHEHRAKRKMKKTEEVQQAKLLKPRVIKDAIEVLTTIIQGGVDWDAEIIKEYPDQNSKVTKAVQTILLASLRGAPYLQDENTEAGPLSAIIPIIPKLVSPDLHIIYPNYL